MTKDFEKPKYLRARGRKTIELPFLMSCALYLLDRRYWIVGVRYPWYGVRFDLVVRDPSLSSQTGLVEVKYRGDGRPVRPYEDRAFSQGSSESEDECDYVLWTCYLHDEHAIFREGERVGDTLWYPSVTECSVIV